MSSTLIIRPDSRTPETTVNPLLTRSLYPWALSQSKVLLALEASAADRYISAGPGGMTTTYRHFVRKSFCTP